MATNSVIETMLKHKSIRKFTDEVPSDELIDTIVRAAQQAPFASQLYSLVLSREVRRKHPFRAPLLFTILVDLHKLELFMARRGWKVISNDLSLLLFGIQDASLMAQNLILAGESVGLGSVLLGAAPYRAQAIAERYKLPPRVFPLVQLAMGYPAEDPPPRPRYPLDFTLFRDEYPEIDEDTLTRAMETMDEGYLAQDYYVRAGFMIPLEVDREETYDFETYSWTEHISRKWGQWHPSASELLEQMAHCGLKLEDSDDGSED
jgi:nitroreductase